MKYESMLTLYKSLVQPHMDYCSQLWYPHKINDMQRLEGVQRSFTSRISGLEQLNYWQRLENLKLYSVQRRFQRYIIIYMWKVLEDLIVPPETEIVVSTYSPRNGRLCKKYQLSNNSSTRLHRQIELDSMCNWSVENEMEFNIKKCKVIQAGSANVNFQYKMNGVNLESVDSYKDLGVHISNNLKVEKQCKEAYRKANMQLGFIARNFQYKSKDIILPLYKSIVRPHLEYAVQAWTPYYQKDLDLLVRIQHRATKLIPNLRHKPYEERLESLGLTTLKTRRLRGQLIQAFKIIKQFDKVDPKYFFKFDENSRTRGNELKLKYKTGIYVTDIGKNFFTNSIVKDWNSLPNNVIDSTSINMFKNRIDKHFKYFLIGTTSIPNNPEDLLGKFIIITAVEDKRLVSQIRTIYWLPTYFRIRTFKILGFF